MLAETGDEHRHERRAGKTYPPRDRHTFGIKPGGEPCHAAGPVEIMADILLARPHHLDRRIDFFGDQHRLTDILLYRCAPAEAAAQHHAVDHNLIVRHAGSDGGGHKRGRGALRRRPNLDPLGRDMRRTGLRLHGGVGQVRDGVFRLDAARGACECAGDIAVRSADLGIIRVERGAHAFKDLGRGKTRIAAIVPDDRQRLQRTLRAPPGIGHNRNRIGHAHHATHAFHRSNNALVDRLQLAAVNRALSNRGVQHPRQPHVDGVDRLRGDFGEDVEPPARCARKRPLAGLFQLDVLRRRNLRRIFSDGPEGQFAAARPMRDRAGASQAFRRRHIPTRRGGRDQHLARGGAGLPQIKLRGRDRAAGAGRHVAPNFMAVKIFEGGDELGTDVRPITFEFFRDQHGEPGLRALPHFGVRDANHRRIVRVNDQPCGDFRATPQPHARG